MGAADDLLLCEGTEYDLELLDGAVTDGATLLVLGEDVVVVVLLVEGADTLEFVLVRVVVVLYDGRVVVLLLLYVGVYVRLTELYSGLVTASLLLVVVLTVVVGCLSAVLVAVDTGAVVLEVADCVLILVVVFAFTVLVAALLLTVEVAVLAVVDVDLLVEATGATLLLVVDKAVLLLEESDLLAAKLLLLSEEVAPVPAVAREDKLLTLSLLPY